MVETRSGSGSKNLLAAARQACRPAARDIGVLAFALVLSGCAGTSGGPQVSSARAVREVPVSRSFVLPAPGGPRIVSVIEKQYGNALEQRIALSTAATTPGQSEFRVQVFGVGRKPFGQTLKSALPDAATIAAELSREFPGVAMHVSPLFAQNDYGPFGYATGRGKGRDLCFYGWQRLGGNEWVAKGSIQLRLRLCRPGASERDLLDEMYRFSLAVESDRPGWNPYGKPAPLSMEIGRPMHPIEPEGFGAPEAAAAPTRSSPARTHNRAPASAFRSGSGTARSGPASLSDLPAPQTASGNLRRGPVPGGPDVPLPPTGIRIWPDRDESVDATPASGRPDVATLPSSSTVPEIPSPKLSGEK